MFHLPICDLSIFSYLNLFVLQFISGLGSAHFESLYLSETFTNVHWFLYDTLNSIKCKCIVMHCSFMTPRL